MPKAADCVQLLFRFSMSGQGTFTFSLFVCPAIVIYIIKIHISKFASNNNVCN